MGVAALRRRLVASWRGSTRVQDAVAAVGTFGVGLVLNLVGLTGIWATPRVEAPWWWHTVLLSAGCLAMLAKRQHPVAALCAGTLIVAVDAALGSSMALVIVLFDLLFAVGMFGSVRARTTVTTVVFVLIGTASVVSGYATGEFRVAVFVGLQLTTLLFVPLWWAANVRQQRELGALTAGRRARDAVAAERAAMARDLHDVIAAHLSTTAIHSGAALALAPDTQRDRAALQAVRTSSLAALEEMRSMIMLLRTEVPVPTPPAPPGGLDRLTDLIGSAAASGLRAEADAPVIPDVPAVVQHAAVRIVHEALTNARKHAPESQVRVDVAESGGHLVVTVTNTLTRTGGLGHRALSAGTGLASMRERAALLGGSLTVGHEQGRWRVRARLPLDPPGGSPVGQPGIRPVEQPSGQRA